jgi:hypothetical protein
MNWQHFILWTAGIYILYYLAMILYDLSINKRRKQETTGELTFAEDILPQRIEHLPDKTEAPVTNASPIIASGGVSLKNLFGLCRDEAVQYTSAVSY